MSNKSPTSPWVVIPTYNEVDNISEMIKQLTALPLPGLKILIVDDNSPDGTADIVRKLQATHSNLRLIVRPGKAGLGRAYIHGFSHALEQGADAILQMDADFSHDPQDVPRLFKQLESSDMVIGSRYAEGISVVNWPLSRLLLSTAANFYARVVTSIPLKDTTGGFRAWSAELLKSIDFSTVHADGYGFQIVMSHRAWKKGAKIVEVSIIFTERRLGQSKMSRSIMWEAFWLVWRLRLFGK